jgi:hypothetical protein
MANQKKVHVAPVFRREHEQIASSPYNMSLTQDGPDIRTSIRTE